MKKLLLFSLLATFSYSAQAQCTELFISEYVEGWGTNKAIEIYNPTDSPKELSNYQLERGSNGSTTPSANQKLVLSDAIQVADEPTAVIAPYSTFVIVIDKRDPDGEGQEAPVWDELEAKGDAFAGANYDENNVMYFNGNDAMILRNVTTGAGYVIDRVGRLGENPEGSGDDGQAEGWNNVPPGFTYASNGSVSWTKDHSLIRKSSIEIGDLLPLTLFNPSLEWDSIPPVVYNDDGVLKGNWESLGSHDCECDPGFVSSTSNAGSFDFAMYPNPADRSESVTLSSKESINRYEVLDITGKVIDAKTISNQNEIKIALSNYSTGLYILKAYSGSDLSTRKLIVR